MTVDDVKTCAKVVLKNQVLLFFISAAMYKPMMLSGVRVSAELPTILELLAQVAVCVVVEEVLFYYSHRALHWPRFYKPIHKFHHQFTAPIGLAATYAHAYEFILSNALPIMIGPMLCSANIFSIWVWYFIAITGTVYHHSGKYDCGMCRWACVCAFCVRVCVRACDWA